MKKLTLLVLLGGLSQAAVAQEHKNPLEMMDSDGNGTVSFNEFQENGPNLVSRADADEDGFLSLEEFMSQWPGRRGQPEASLDDSDEASQTGQQRREKFEARMTARFQEMDLDGDDLLSAVEVSEANFLRMDSDNNGALDADELRPPRGKGPRGNKGGKQRRSAGA